MNRWWMKKTSVSPSSSRVVKWIFITHLPIHGNLFLDVILYDDDEDQLDAGYEPFSRESTLRQSISEKRKDPVPRLPNQGDAAKREKTEKSPEKLGMFRFW